MTGVWTNNWRGIKNRMLLGHNTAVNGKTTVYDTSGNFVSYTSNSGSKYTVSPLDTLSNNSNPSYNLSSVRFGTSDTAPAATDYNLGTPWTSNVTYVAVTSGGISRSGDTFSRTCTVTVQNTAAATTSVKEFGIFCRLMSGTTAKDVMIYRGVLDEPVDIAQYESAKITFTVSMTLGDPF